MQLLLELLRNMARRRVRTLLTLLGCGIGVFALTVMGGMSEYFNTLLDSAEKVSGSNIAIQPADRAAESRLNETTIRQLERVPGVREALPSLMDTLDEMGTVNMGVPNMVYGLEPEHVQLALPTVGLARGRWIQRGDTYQAVIGAKVAKSKHLDVGQSIEWRKKKLAVVGILALTNTVPDQFVLVPIETVRSILKLPPGTISGIEVVPADPRRAEELAQRIPKELPHVKAKSPRQAIDEVRQGLLVFNAIMLSSALLAAIVGGLSVINTMLMAVAERTREIGLKKAVGAEDGQILAEYVTEASLMGLVGGLAGLGFGWVMTVLLNAVAAPSLGGTDLWVVTPRLAGTALTFSTGLGAVAGLYPAWRASRLNPVEALRAE